MDYRLTTDQLAELRQAVTTDDIAMIHRLLDSIYHHRQRLEREAREQAQRQCRRAEPWIPER